MSPGRPKSAFSESGMAQLLDELMEEVRRLYVEDGIPWVVGYSGGKDSTATLQLVWLALEGLPEEQRTKPVHVISTDTLVENPVVAAWVNRSLEVMAQSARGVELADRAAQADSSSRRQLLGQPDWQRLSGTTAQVPLVYGTPEDQAV